ncbi:hypothetical protein SAMD00019534_042030 [Acytostelium subglobosum LB1]|uniref:hypothetical protein n=1 Tax=Acytostelium subglobosum LB1 TaxID=1410327 RepID=UPI0006451923|nr:hypothetical protein SAMD00019534_042030 [Acytostelium subglobosum LB1]GAM21028.1 hypothetical protein SAMD00019534_042030 [Acytostelium subglobosum LB1]|eukprot:XP_012756162.1 hypothetical protein SAMD00019534_042030 [Acytostelium subglobosum LB1]
MNAHKPLLTIIHSTICKTIADNVKREFAEICKERQVAPSLSQLEQLIREQPILPNGKRCPLGSYTTPEERTLSQTNHLKQVELEKLRAAYQKLSTENEQINQDIATLEKQKDETLTRLEGKAKALSLLIKSSTSLDQK